MSSPLQVSEKTRILCVHRNIRHILPYYARTEAFAARDDSDLPTALVTAFPNLFPREHFEKVLREQSETERDQTAEQPFIPRHRVYVNDEPARPGMSVRTGDKLTHVLHRHEAPIGNDPPAILMQTSPSDPGFQFGQVMAILKPAGVPVHPTRSYLHQTLTELLPHLAHLQHVQQGRSPFVAVETAAGTEFKQESNNAGAVHEFTGYTPFDFEISYYTNYASRVMHALRSVDDTTVSEDLRIWDSIKGLFTMPSNPKYMTKRAHRIQAFELPMAAPLNPLPEGPHFFESRIKPMLVGQVSLAVRNQELLKKKQERYQQRFGKPYPGRQNGKEEGEGHAADLAIRTELAPVPTTNNSSSSCPDSMDDCPECTQCNVAIHPAHRLDRVTSGLLLVCQNSKASAALGAAIQSGSARKVYLARVNGRFPTSAREAGLSPCGHPCTYDAGEGSSDLRGSHESGEGLPFLVTMPLARFDDDNGDFVVPAPQLTPANFKGLSNAHYSSSCYKFGSIEQLEEMRSEGVCFEGVDAVSRLLHRRQQLVFTKKQEYVKLQKCTRLAAQGKRHQTEESTSEGSTLAQSMASMTEQDFNSMALRACDEIEEQGAQHFPRLLQRSGDACASCGFALPDPSQLQSDVDLSSVECLTAASAFRRIWYDPISDTSLVEARPLTGRTHQLRSHLFWLGHPITNDPEYGGALFEATAVQDATLPDEAVKKHGLVTHYDMTCRICKQLVAPISEAPLSEHEVKASDEVSSSIKSPLPAQRCISLWLHAYRIQLAFDSTPSVPEAMTGKSQKRKTRGGATYEPGTTDTLGETKNRHWTVLDLATPLPSWAANPRTELGSQLSDRRVYPVGWKT